MSVMAPPPGWYPSAPGVVAWWDGQRWTGHVAPQAPTAPVATSGVSTNNVVHAVVSLLTFGLWVPVWLVCLSFQRAPRKPGPPLSPAMTWVAVGAAVALVTLLGALR